MSYQEVTEACFHYGSPTVASYASFSKSLVTFLINMSTFGSACVYNYVIAANLKEFGGKWIGELDIRWYLVCLIFPLIIVNFIKNLKWIAPLSVISNFLIIMVIFCVLSYMIHDLPPISERRAFGDIYLLPQFAGTVFFANSFISLVLPLRNEMKNPHLFTAQPFGVLNVGTLGILILYWVFAFLGFIKYGSAASDTITLNLPEKQVGAEFIQVGVALATLASTPLNFYVLFENIEKDYIHSETSCQLILRGNIMRITVILLSVLISCLVPNLNLLLSLLGIAANCCLSMLLPSILHLTVFEKLPTFYFLLDYFIILLSIILFVTGTVTNVKDILNFYSL